MINIFEREVEYNFFRKKFPELISGKNNEVMRAAIRYGLTDIQRETLLQYYVDRLKPVEIARRRGVCPSTVCRTLHRARKNLYHAARYIGAI